MTGPTREEVERPIDEEFDTMMEVEKNPTGAWMGIQTLAAENAALRERLEGADRDNHRWQQNSRDTWNAMQAMRNSINEHLPMPSAESDLLQGPESSIFCAAVAEAVIAALTESRAREAAAWEAVETLMFIRDAITESITASDIPTHRVEIDGVWHTGPVVDWAHKVLTGLRDISANVVAKLALTPPTDATAALTTVKDAEWNAAIEALRKAVIARFEISPITVLGTTIYGHGMILADPLLHEIDALRRNPKEGV